MIRNSIKKKKVTPSISMEERVKLLSAKLDLALKEIAALKIAITFTATPDKAPWTFDIERDTHGKIKGVTAQKEHTPALMM